MPIFPLLCSFLRILLTELHAHAFEQFAVAAADLSIWVWQLMPPRSATTILAGRATTTLSAVVLTQSLPHIGLIYQPIQSLIFQSIELTLWQSAAPNVSTPKLVTAWAVIIHRVPSITLDQNVNKLGGEMIDYTQALC